MRQGKFKFKSNRMKEHALKEGIGHNSLEFSSCYISNKKISNDVCQKIIELGDGHWEETKQGSYRSSQVAWNNEQWLYDLIWDHMIDANDKGGWRYYITAAEAFQITKYFKGGYYKWHLDGQGSHKEKFNEPNNPLLHGYARKLSMTILLNDEFKGGEFEIRDKLEGKIKIKKGSMLFFPSFIEHRVKPVTEGVRYSLVCWFVGPPFV